MPYSRREISRMSDARLHARAQALDETIDAQGDEPSPALVDEYAMIDDELEARAMDAHEPVDYDQQDRNAASAERYDNFRNER